MGGRLPVVELTEWLDVDTAVTSNSKTYRLASSGLHVEIGGSRRISKAATQFLLIG